MFGILDRYIGRTVIMAILICTFGLVGLSSLIKFIEQLNNVGDGNFTTLHALYRVFLLMPGELVLFFPMGALLGGVIGLGQMASSSELVVLQAAGLSRTRIVLSALKTVIPVMLLVMLLGEYVAPLGVQKAKDIKTAAVSGGKITASANGILASGSPSCSAESTQDFVTTAAIGYASPISSLAITSSRLHREMISPASISRAA